MTLDEIQKMSDADLNAAINEQVMDGTVLVLRFAGDLNACGSAEERLKETGLGERWIDAMIRTVISGSAFTQGWKMFFALIHATARQRAEAILLAVQKGD